MTAVQDDILLAFGEKVLRLLRQMDAEATTISGETECGLNWYGWHSRPEMVRPRTEPEWSRRLALLLREGNKETDAERRYPTTREFCDVVIVDPEERRIWLEIKGGWKTYWRQAGKVGRYLSYLNENTLHDVHKLSSLTREDADAIALLLIGFDEETDPMDAEVEQFEALAGVGSPPWLTIARDAWPDARRPGETVKVWMWAREVPG